LQWQSLYDRERPFQLLTQLPPGAEDQRTTNLVFDDVVVEVEDVRSAAFSPTLDGHGFMFRICPSVLPGFTDQKMVEEQYFLEVEKLIKANVVDAKQVYIFDWRLRNTAPESAPGTVLDLNDRTTYLRPAIHFHVDQSPAGVLKRVMSQLPEYGPKLLKGRVQIVNVWRPQVDCIGDWPIALCDGGTVDSGDLIEADLVRRDYTGSSLYLQKNSKQKFYFLSAQGKNDVLFLKIFDSKTKGIMARCCPHASFRLPYEEPDGSPRTSIEVRCLVFSSEEEKIPLGYHQQVQNSTMAQNEGMELLYDRT